MTSAQTTPIVNGPPPEPDRPGAAAHAVSHATGGAAGGASDGHVLREAMLSAIGELSDAERARLASTEQPDDLARAWRDLLAERAAREREAAVREREAAVRSELTREFETRAHAAQPRPTTGLHGGPPTVPPRSVAEWTDYIRASGEGPVRQRRRAQFADWLAAHPNA